ncbi:MAG: hypothetical protein CMI54_02530 [Parcubacteria group bacterium]|nr:hypothetical protein [Parcubacteria group bacterium]|tara:strand:+ start:5186 stop:5497 length:312 start_codon:yes stop_codon:yes gene_type:complete
MLNKLQEEQKNWSLYNFGKHPAYWPLLGAVEELGELAHAHLKEEQGIRTEEDHVALAKDSIGDIIIFLADYCTVRGFDFEEIVQETWNMVKKRDWKKNPGKGQ